MQLHGLAAKGDGRAIPIDDVWRPCLASPELACPHLSPTQAPIAVEIESCKVVHERTCSLRFFNAAVAIGILQGLPRQQRRSVRRRHQILGHVFMGDECGRVSEHLATAGVVVMRVAVDDISDRNVETAVEFALQPCRSSRVGRIHEDDALRGMEKHPIVAHVTESIEVPGQVNDLPARRSRWRPFAELGLRNTLARQQHRRRSHQKARLWTYGHATLLEA